MSLVVAKLFKNGQSQAVRLPKEFRFNGDEVYIQKYGDKLIISEKKTSWDNFFKQKSFFDEDFLTERDNNVPQERDFF